MKRIKPRGRGISFLQNLCILCLSVLAGVLLVVVFSYASHGSGTLPALDNFLGAPAAGEAESSDLSGMAAPCNLVATSEQGRYGCMLAGDTERSLLHASSLLLEALGSAGSGAMVTEDAFRAALDGTGLFLDYLFPIPTAVLAGWFGAELSAEGATRYVLISGAGRSSAALYLWDGIGEISRYDTAVESAALESLVRSLSEGLGDVAFAFEDPEAYGHLAPYAVLSSETAEARLLTSSLPPLASDVDTLLSMLDFNPHTIARYNLSNGMEVVEYPRTFRVYNDGVVQYSGDTDTASSLYTIPSAGEDPSQAEAVLAARRLAEVLLPAEMLQGTEFYFTGIRPTEAGYAITFDYLVDGIPVYLARGGAALEIETTGSVITAFRLQYRQYTPQEGTYHLLPLAQAVHMAADREDSFLTMGYVDRGGESVRAEWLIR